MTSASDCAHFMRRPPEIMPLLSNAQLSIFIQSFTGSSDSLLYQASENHRRKSNQITKATLRERCYLLTS